MLTRIADAGGTLLMPLSEPVDDRTGTWSDSRLAPLPALATRRRRRIDVVARDGYLQVQAHFRDSYADPDGTERGLHGYSVSLSVDPSGRVSDADAEGVVLPWPECWRVTGSARRLLGLTLGEIEQTSKTDLVGHGTCTHLNDTLRALVDVAQLADLVNV